MSPAGSPARCPRRDLKLPAGAPEPTGGLVAFDIQPDGSLTNERQFAWAVATAQQSIRTGASTRPAMEAPGSSIRRLGAFLGYFATPLGTHGLHFGGANKRTLFAITLNAQTSVWAIDTLSQGFQVGEWRR